VAKATKEAWESGGLWGPRDFRALTAKQVLPVRLDQRAFRDATVSKEKRAPPVTSAVSGPRAALGQQESPERRDPLVLWERKATKD